MAGCCGAEITVVPVDSMTKILPEAAAFMPARDTAETAIGAHATFQAAFRSPFSITDLSVKCTGFEGLEIVRAGLVGLVGIGETTPEAGHDYIRSVSGLYPDPISTEGPWSVPAGQASSAWVTVRVPSDAAPGVYSGSLLLKGRAGGQRFSRSVPLVLKVWDVRLEKQSLLCTNWNFDFEECLSKWNGGAAVEFESPDYWEYMRQMAAALAEGHQNVTRVPLFELIGMKDVDGEWQFDFTRFNKTVRLYEEAGVLDRLQCGELGHRIEPSWTAGFGLFVPQADGSKELYPIDNPLVIRFYKAFLPALVKDLKENGWWEKTWQQVCDEPIDANADNYRQVIAFIRSIEPSIRVMEAVQTTRLAGAMDVWVPQLDTWHNNYDFFRSRQAAGDEVWFYTCCFPRREYPNRFIEQPLLKTRGLYWLAAKYGATGYLHWGFNYWTGDLYRTADRPGTDVMLPAGDCWIVYPGYRKFESSIRFEAMRDGIEDHTLLTMLARKDPAAASALCDRMLYNCRSAFGQPSACPRQGTAASSVISSRRRRSSITASAK